VACIVTLGGDGTNRMVSKTCSGTPLLPVSTGTNNVFPFMVEGTLAGLAAGVAAQNPVSSKDFIKQVPRLEIRRDDGLVDIALVDVVVSKAGFIGSRALWDVTTLQEIFLARATPGNIGFSSVGGHLADLTFVNGKGAHILIGPGLHRVKAPIAPGLIRWVPIQSYRLFEPGEEIPISRTPAVIALDGERERLERGSSRVTVRLNPEGPWVVDVSQALKVASEKGLFVSDTNKEVR